MFSAAHDRPHRVPQGHGKRPSKPDAEAPRPPERTRVDLQRRFHHQTPAAREGGMSREDPMWRISIAQYSPYRAMKHTGNGPPLRVARQRARRLANRKAALPGEGAAVVYPPWWEASGRAGGSRRPHPNAGMRQSVAVQSGPAEQ